MRYIFFILILFCSLTTYAENKLARINDPDGFTNIHSGQGNDFPIVAKLEIDDFFYCDLTNDEWLKIVALKWQDGKQIEGYIHKSRVQFIESLDIKTKQEVLTKILSKQKALAESFQKAWKSKDSLAYKTTRQNLEMYDDTKYSPILDILPKYFCKTKDTVVLQLFFETMWADKGSANESPSDAIGKCFICQSDILLKQLRKLKNKKQRTLLYDHINFGLLNDFDVNENGKSENKEFIRLKKQLDEEKKASP